MADRIGDDPRSDLAALAASEIVTNALMHGGRDDGAAIELHISQDADGVVRVEVVNRAEQVFVAEQVGAHEPGQVGGWGLGIVQTVSVDWGVSYADGSTSVWFVV